MILVYINSAGIFIGPVTAHNILTTMLMGTSLYIWGDVRFDSIQNPQERKIDFHILEAQKNE